jgi:hypothetical protein
MPDNRIDNLAMKISSRAKPELYKVSAPNIVFVELYPPVIKILLFESIPIPLIKSSPSPPILLTQSSVPSESYLTTKQSEAPLFIRLSVSNIIFE